MYNHPPFIIFSGDFARRDCSQPLDLRLFKSDSWCAVVLVSFFWAHIECNCFPVRTTVDGTQVWSCSITFPLSFPTIRITSSENSTINLWILINTSQSNQSISEGSFYKEKQYTTPLILPPNTSIAVYYTVAQIIYGKTVWFKLIPGMYMVLFQSS